MKIERSPDSTKVVAETGVGLSAASFGAEHSLPSTRVACSRELGWETALARIYEDPDQTEGFTTSPSPDLLIVINLSGTFNIESRGAKGWSRAAYRPGAIGVTAPGRTSTLRWRHEPSARRRSLHLFLGASLLQSTADSLGAPGLISHLPDALLLDDPVVLAVGGALGDALAQGLPALHADALAQALALHIIYGRGVDRRESVAIPSVASAAGAVPRARAYLRDHLAEEVKLDAVARAVSVSKFPLLRIFAKETGETPHRHLVRLRMQRASGLLRATDATVLRIATECGYRSAGQFAAAFRRHYGAAPSEYRRGLR